MRTAIFVYMLTAPARPVNDLAVLELSWSTTVLAGRYGRPVRIELALFRKRLGGQATCHGSMSWVRLDAGTGRTLLAELAWRPAPRLRQGARCHCP